MNTRKRIPGARTWFGLGNATSTAPVESPRVLFIRKHPYIPDRFWLEDANHFALARDTTPGPLAQWARDNGYTLRDPEHCLAP